MPTSDYLSSNMIICIFFDAIHFRELGQKCKNIFDRFLDHLKTSKSAFEINWPLESILFYGKWAWEFQALISLAPRSWGFGLSNEVLFVSVPTTVPS